MYIQCKHAYTHTHTHTHAHKLSYISVLVNSIYQTHTHTQTHRLHVYIGVSGACVEWIYVAGTACVVRGKADHTKLFSKHEVSVMGSDRMVELISLSPPPHPFSHPLSLSLSFVHIGSTFLLATMVA